MRAEVDQRWLPILLAGEDSFRLGDLEIHPATRQLSFKGRSETLEPRVMQVLVALAKAREAVLSRDELLARCWDGRVVGDNAIHRVIGKVRELGLTFGGHFRVETITKVGYRLVVEDKPADIRALVTEERPLVLASPTVPTAAVPLGAWSRRKALALGLGGASAAAAGYLAIQRGSGDRRVNALLAQSEHAISQALPDSDAQGVGFLEEAASLRPGDARVWGRLALANGIVAEYAPPDATADAVAKTREAARRALELDPRNADALAALALLPPYFGDWNAAEQRMKAVLAMHPDHIPTRDALDFLRVAVGRTREGAQSRLSYAGKFPLSAHHQFRAIYAHWALDEIGEADRAAERGLQLWPKHPAIWLAHLWALAFTGRPERALARVEDAAARPDLPPWMIDALQSSMRAIASEDRKDAARAIQALFELLNRGPSHSINAILILNGMGEIDLAFDVAEAYLLDRGPIRSNLRWAPGDISINDQRRRKTNMLFVPVSARMRADPRFRRLTDEIGLDSYWRAAGVVPDHLV